MTAGSGEVTTRTGVVGRLAFLDALRGIAVGLVLFEHVGELLVPGVRQAATSAVQFGQMGVLLFFLCSGFIIPASLERRGADGGSRLAEVRGFWRSRFFRLYPMYWVSLGAAAVLAAIGRYPLPAGVDGRAWLVGATMTQGLVGLPDVVGVYWSLAFELIFYLAVSLLFLVGLHRRSVLLSLLCSGGCLALAAAGPLLGRSAPLGIFCVVTMFTGTVVARWHAGTVRLRTLALCVGAALASGVALLAGTLLGHDQPAFLGTRSFAPMAAAWTGAYVLFFAGVALRRHRAPGWLRRLGVVSYAVYLLHPLVLAAVPRVGGAAGTALVWTAITLLLAEVAHRAVERPAIALGRRLRLRRVSGSSAVASVDPAPFPVPAPAGAGG